MKIPFSTEQNLFETEFKEALGFTDVDIPLRKIKPDLISAAHYLIQIIGQPTYDQLILNSTLNIEGENEAVAPFKDVDLDIAYKNAIAIYGYFLFAPSNDLGHTSNGRKMRQSEDEKTPFEWMMARDDDNLQKRAYRSIDVLLNYMDENFKFWKESEKFKVTHKHFVRTIEDFNGAFVIESRLLLAKLIPGIEQCERREIIPRIGKTTYDALKTKVIYIASGKPDGQEDPGAITEPEALLLDYIKDASAYYALYWGLPRLQLNLFPEGILQSVRGDRTTIRGRSVPQVPIIDQASKLFKGDCDNALMRIEESIKEMFPPIIDETIEEEEQSDYAFDDDDNFAST